MRRLLFFVLCSCFASIAFAQEVSEPPDETNTLTITNGALSGSGTLDLTASDITTGTLNDLVRRDLPKPIWEDATGQSVIEIGIVDAGGNVHRVQLGLMPDGTVSWRYKD